MPREILLGVEIHAGAASIVEAVTTKEGLSSFWVSTSIAEPEAGTEARFTFQGAPVPLRMRVDRIEPNEVAWTCLGEFPHWEGTTVTWSLEPGPEHGGTRLLFRHAGFSDAQTEWEFASVSYTWGTILERLKQLAETGSARPALG